MKGIFLFLLMLGGLIFADSFKMKSVEAKFLTEVIKTDGRLTE